MLYKLGPGRYVAAVQVSEKQLVVGESTVSYRDHWIRYESGTGSGSVCWLGMRAKRAIVCLAKNARQSHGAPGSLAGHKRLAWDDNGKLTHHSCANRRGDSFLGQDFANTADLCANAAQFFFNVFITAIDVVDAINDGFAIRDKSR